MTNTATTNIKTRGRGRTVLKEGMHRGMTRGMAKVAVGDYWNLREQLLAVFGGSRCKMTRSIAGQRIIYPDDTRKVEAIFRQFGITDIWDE